MRDLFSIDSKLIGEQNFIALRYEYLAQFSSCGWKTLNFNTYYGAPWGEAQGMGMKDFYCKLFEPSPTHFGHLTFWTNFSSRFFFIYSILFSSLFSWAIIGYTRNYYEPITIPQNHTPFERTFPFKGWLSLLDSNDEHYKTFRLCQKPNVRI